MLKQLLPSTLLTLLLTVLLGLGYPLAMTGLAGTLFPNQAHGSLIEKNGAVVGSALIGQGFTKPEYFHPRPSATTDADPNDPTKTVSAPYNAANSGASNAAPTSKSYIESTQALVDQVKAENPDARVPLPVDLITASGSGLDPHISPAAAEYQLPRIARARGISENELRALVTANTEGRVFGILGEAAVNVLKLNLALDRRGSAAR
ncbi:potassium-transporting ATPase subunit C [Paramagnetospirillum kuznetsovii]|uniref:Potassium-transporting ATPase KdpC subunit n=1 Tax=Paramagnetospirillum kuznetsovii TaxID=2053833 RepID=A0A364NX54_9PROT|nr:potassium-transporting ATPase subunit KdpC [Paramagnetospirillum kuznetsovii]RAU21679.1 potassium-transporting ATPase subunit C [Paramagnetospirillum kuznetsovii]